VFLVSVTFTTLQWPGDADEMTAEFEIFIIFYQKLSENGISKSTVEVVENWFQKKTKNNTMQKYC
jgi:hypothetical protein